MLPSLLLIPLEREKRINRESQGGERMKMKYQRERRGKRKYKIKEHNMRENNVSIFLLVSLVQMRIFLEVTNFFFERNLEILYVALNLSFFIFLCFLTQLLCCADQVLS